MKHGFLRWRSLKTKVSLATLGIFLACIWSLSIYASRMLREDMQRQQGEQQFTTASMVAAQIGNELETRLSALHVTAEATSKVLREAPATLQTFLDQRAAMKVLFNGGFLVLDEKGVAIADFPTTAGRAGVNYGDSDFIAAALKEGKTSISQPIVGRKLSRPIIVMIVPMYGEERKIIGALSGIINLEYPNFLDQITGNRYGKTGGYILAAPRARLIVTATQKELIMQAMPVPGQYPAIDRFNEGFEGTTVFLPPEGIEVLASVKQIPLADWYVVASLPIEEAFAPIRDMQRRMLAATLLLSLLAGALTWWILRHQLSPLIETADRLAGMANENQPLRPLPITRKDEIGRLIAGFNRLLTTLDQREALLKNIFDTSSVAIFLVDNQGRIIQANRRMSEMFACPLDTLIGSAYVSLIHPSERETGDRKMRELLASGPDSVDVDRLYWRADRSEFWGHLTGRCLYDADGKKLGLVGVIADIDVRKKVETQLERMAHYDMLTGLPNRVLLADRLHLAMVQAQRHGHPLAVAYLDLDGFKSINDSCGHEVGDQLLVMLAQRMKTSLREGDTLARLGGDEFVAVLQDLSDTASSISLLDRVLAAVSHPATIGSQILQVSGSIGVTFYPQGEGVDADQLLRQADQAMYQAKLAGKNRYHIFDADQDQILRGHHESLQRIQEALAAGEFVLFFQPKVNMSTGAVTGSEALIRWQHPEKGLLPPSAFLPLIENHRISVDIGEWVIDAALSAQESWRERGLHIPVSVNIGAPQLQQPDFVDRLRDLLARHGAIQRGDLELEILETSALEDLPGISRVIRRCLELGVGFALDDFGTGYSSLTYLKRLPVNTLKIDQSFVRGMLNDPDDLAILEGVVGLAAAFHRDIVAEGVETIEHGRLLLQLGCRIAQGYGIARPMPADDLPAWAATWRPDKAWRNVKPVNNADFSLLAAGVAHRVWLASVEQYLAGTLADPPVLSYTECRFGKWFSSDGKRRYGTSEHFRHTEALHRQIHRIAEDLCRRKADGTAADDAQLGLGELRELCEVLLAQLSSLNETVR